MRTGTGLTIRDYFDRVNYKGAAGTVRRNVTGGAFARALASAGAGRVDHDSPMTIQDYFKTPVRNRSALPSVMPPAGRPDIQGTTAQPLPMPEPMAPSVQPKDLPEPEDELTAIEAGIHRAAARYDLSPALIRAVVKAESDYQSRAVSPAGAQGLMQLMPATACELGVTDPFDVHQNIDGGTRYLRQMLDRFEGDIKCALAAYNAGPGTVCRYGGVPPYPETRAYVDKVLRFSGIPATVTLS